LHAPDLVPADVYLRLVQSGLSVGQSYPKVLDAALVSDSENSELLMLKGVTRFLSDDPQSLMQGRRHIQTAFQTGEDKQALKQNTAIAIRNLASYFHRANQVEKAVGFYRYALELQPGYVATLTHLGRALYQMGNREESFQSLRKAVQLDAGSGPALQNLGTVLFMEGDVEEAVQVYRKAL